MSSPPPALTLGMQLDAALSQLDSLSSPQLYTLIVLVTVLIATLLLGNAQPLDETAAVLMKATSAATATATATTGTATSKTMTTTTKNNQGREPRWYIFRLFNYAIMIAFGASVVEFLLHADLYAKDQTLLARVLAAWCLCLIYFFGFFGVFIVHDDCVEQQQEGQTTTTTTAAAGAGAPLSLEKSLADTLPSKNLGCGIAATSTCKMTHNNNNTKTLSTDKTTSASASTAVVQKTKKPDPPNYKDWNDMQLAQLVLEQHWKDHELEKKLDPHRAVQVRRCVVQQKIKGNHENEDFDWTENLPSQPSLDYSAVHGANCEIVIGYVPLPVGLVGPLIVNGQAFYVPMATTEGCLVASTNRGAKAICAGGGATAVVTRDGITRAPCLRLPSAARAAQLKLWCDETQNLVTLQQAFASTTRYGKLTDVQVTVAGRNAYVRLVCASGDAMGMNMVSKGALAVIDALRQHFDDSLELVALSGNMCTDKKAAAVNWLQGRGKSVVVEAIVPADVVRTTLKTTVAAMVHTNLHKNLIGSAMAGSLGGFNAHAANIVTAVFLATGQDPAQNVESSQCITLLEETEAGDLWMSCTMPSLEVGTVGGGTRLAAQAACLELVGCRGGDSAEPGANARKLATVVAAATLAGEMSLLAALAANTLVQAHMQHNRKT